MSQCQPPNQTQQPTPWWQQPTQPLPPQYSPQQGYNQPQWQQDYPQYPQQPQWQGQPYQQTQYPQQPEGFQQPQQTKKPVSKGTKIGCGVAAAVIVLVIIIAAVASASGNSGTPPVAQPTQPTQKPKEQPTVKVASNPNNVKPTHGTPRIGGPISDFYGKYGQPSNQGTGNWQTWIADQQNKTIVNATPNSSGKTATVIVTTAANWSDQQTKTYCEQFLPPDANQYNTIDNITNYHSSVGRIVMQQSQASCVITIGGR